MDFLLFQLNFQIPISKKPNFWYIPETTVSDFITFPFGFMGEDDEQPPPPPLPSKSKSFPLRPTINLPPRTSMESLFSSGPGLGFGFSPGPMTLVSSFFSDSDDCKSFSQLLAGAMASPVTAVPSSSSEFKASPGLLDSPGLQVITSKVHFVDNLNVRIQILR